MFVTVFKYRAQAGEEDAIIALHEDWQRNQQLRAKGYLTGELLRNVADPGEFIAIMHFKDQESAHLLADDLEQNAWYRRVASLTEKRPMLAEYTSQWQGSAHDNTRSCCAN